MVELQEIGSFHEHYGFVEELLHTAFPENERRDDDKQRWNTDYEAKFHCLVGTKQGVPVGILTYWEFDTFLYIEHLATDTALRGKGMGREMLRAFLSAHTVKPLVLEVEHPIDETSRRRINFYEHCGFCLWVCDYLQPPYRESDGWLPLYLMVTQGLSFEEDYALICQTIHQNVYGRIK